MADEHANTRFNDVRRFDEVDSTNAVAAALARDGASEGVVVVADHQTAGRGRLGRRWQAAPGSSLLVSVLLRPSPTGGRIGTHLTTFAMAVAASDACTALAPGVRPLLKWPNDLVVGDRKLGGVLGETVADAVVVGLGLNVNWGDEWPPHPGVALDALVGRALDRSLLLAALLQHLEQWLSGDPALLVEEYRTRSATLGRRVRVELFAGTIEGDAVAITADGHLVVDESGKPRVVTAGDVVHVRPTDP